MEAFYSTKGGHYSQLAGADPAESPSQHSKHASVTSLTMHAHSQLVGGTGCQMTHIDMTMVIFSHPGSAAHLSVSSSVFSVNVRQ